MSTLPVPEPSLDSSSLLFSFNYRVRHSDDNDVPIVTADISQVHVLTQQIILHDCLYHPSTQGMCCYYNNDFHFSDKEAKVLTLAVIAQFIKLSWGLNL